MFPSKVRVGMLARVDKTRVVRGGIYADGELALLKTLALVDYVFVLAVDAGLLKLLEDIRRNCDTADGGTDSYAAAWKRWRCPILIATRCGTVGWLHRDDVECLEHVWREPA